MRAEHLLKRRTRRLLSRVLRPVQTLLWRGALRLVDTRVMLQAVTPGPSRVLLVRLDNIGDFVVWLDAARAMVEHFRSEGKSVTLVANAAWAELAESLRLFDEIIPVQPRDLRKNLHYRADILSRVRKGQYGSVLQPTLNRIPETGDAVVRVSGAKLRTGVLVSGQGRTKAKSKLRGLYTTLVDVDLAAGEMQANAMFVRAVTGKPYRARVADLSAAVDPALLDGLAQVVPDTPYVVLFPGASEPGRQWPEEHFAAIARNCFVEHGWPVLVCGGPADALIADRIVDQAGIPVISLAGNTSLPQLATVLAGAALLVSNETSAVHMAAALGVPSICITGGGHYGRFVPYKVEQFAQGPLPLIAAKQMPCFGCDWKCKFHPAKGKPMPCVEDVPVDAVWNLAEGILNQSASRSVEGAALCI